LITTRQPGDGQRAKGKGKGQVLDIALLHDEHMLRGTEVAADWHELITP